MRSADIVEREKKAERENSMADAIKALELNQKRKKQPISSAVEPPLDGNEGDVSVDTPPVEEIESGDAIEYYIIKQLLKSLDLPEVLASFIHFEDGDTFRKTLEELRSVIKYLEEKAFKDGFKDGREYQAEMNGQYKPKSADEEPEIAKQIADTMGVKVPNVFKKNKKRSV